jgi:hypothetical protein
MTKDEAIQILKDNNMCPKHGVYLLSRRDGYWYADTPTKYYCQLCEDEKRKELASKIKEAIGVLGINEKATR